MTQFQVSPIGTVRNTETDFTIRLEPKYIPALEGLEGFSHIQMLWWCSELDTEEARSVLAAPKPYKNGPDTLGIFATRSPVRPNPIAITAVQVLGIHHENGVVQLAWTDAYDGTPVLDIKPYTPSSDRVEAPAVPDWCDHWPKSLEDSDGFDWEAQFNF